jgi:hypothetical protein
MPRIAADYIVQCSVYLYETERAAKEGHKSGGSGFLAHVPSETNPGLGHLYAITNKHILDRGFHVLRLTKKSGGIDTVPTRPEDWIRHPKCDVAVIAIEFSHEDFQWWSVGTDLFITHEIIETYNIGLGDEAFLIGRLVTHAGKQKNAPISRFGNVSLMADPSEPIRCQDYEQEGFLVECRSLSGFSGSPVFVETRQGYEDDAAQKVAQHRGADLLSKTGPPGKVEGFQASERAMWIRGRFGPWLLGIDWGHIPLWRNVYKNDHETKTDLYVEANTGIACVLPAWYIGETLYDEDLVKARREEEKKLAQKLKAESASVNDVALEPSAQPFSKEDFESALKKAARKVSSKK